MDKKRVIALIVGVILVLAVSFKFYLDSKDQPEEGRIATADSKEFKKQYESLNNTKNSNDVDYLNVSIPENNPVIIKSDTEINDILKNGTGVVYFGFNSCPWCRSLVETLLQSFDDNNLKNL